MSVCLYHDPASHPELDERSRTKWACTCQPPTIWGKSYLWHCDCCEQPRAERKFTLCPECERHQYAHHITVEADHMDMSNFDSPLPGLRAGAGASLCLEPR